MELANCTLALGGDSGQLIQKFAVTPSEVAVLRTIHGADAVTDIKVFGSVERTGANERRRLIESYGKGMDGQIRAPAVERLFPGVAARLFETFAEIDVVEEGELDLSAETVVPVAPAKKSKSAKKAAEPDTAFE